MLGGILAFMKVAGWTPHNQEIVIYGVLANQALWSLLLVRRSQNQVAVLRLFAALFLFEVGVLCLPHGSTELAMRYTALPVFYAGLMIRGVWSFRQESSP